MEGFFIFKLMRVKINILLFSLILLVPFVPYFGTIDKIGSQWFYLSIINLCIVFYNFFHFDYLKNLKKLFNYPQFFSYSLFFLFCVLSLFYSNNLSLSLVEISRIIITIFSVINIYIFLSHHKLDLVSFSKLISIVLFIEVLISFIPLIDFLWHNDLSTLDFNKLQISLLGVSGNRNVLSFDLVFKLIFVIYLFFRSNIFYKILSFLLIFSTTTLLSLLSSRAVLFCLLLVTIILIVHLFLSKSNYKSFVFIIPIFLSFSITSLLDSNRFNPVSKVSSVGLSDDSTTHRLFLYDNAIDFIYKNPFIGCGIGNWKVESLPYWKNRLSGYTIPYHAHNDFLEIATETGFFGGLFYLLFFLIILCHFFLSYYKTRHLDKLIVFILCFVYLLDANFNFPMERALSQVNLIILFTLSLLLFQKKPYEKTI